MFPAFEQVTRRNHAAVKTSALFKFVAKKPAALKFDSVTYKIIADGNAYILSFKEPIDSNAVILYAEDGYAFDTKRPPHIRFDREYGNPNSSIYRNKFFAHWHYTERLIREADGTTIELHYYFHRNILLDIVVKGADGTKSILETSDRIKLGNNTERATAVMGLLFKALDKYKEELNDRFEALVVKTSSNEFIKKATAEVLRTHLQQLEELGGSINELEEDYKDCRIDIIRRRFELCIENKLASQAASKTTVVETTDTSVATEATLLSVATTPPAAIDKGLASSKGAEQKALAADVLATLFDEANSLVASYATVKAVDLVGLDTRRQNLINELLVAFISTKDAAKLKAIKEKQASILALQDLRAYLEQYLLTGDFENFVTLYESAALKVTMKSFAKYIGIFITDEFARRESEHVKICEYLYQNASEYAVFLEFIRSVTNILEGELGDEKVVLCSLFNIFVNHDLFDFFKMVIRQIRNPNVFGLQVGKHIMSLILSIMQLDSTEKYVDFLIEQGAKTEGMSYSQQYLFIEQIPANNKLSALAILPSGRGAVVTTGAHRLSQYDVNIVIAKANSCLASSLLCDFMPDSVTNKFAALASLYDVAYATAYHLSTADRVGKVNTNFTDMRTYETNEQKNQDFELLFTQSVAPRNHFVFGFYFASPAQRAKSQLSIDLLKSRIIAASEPERHAVIKKLTETMQACKKAQDWQRAIVLADAALYCTNYISTNIQNHKFIVWLLGQMVQINQLQFAATRDQRYQLISDALQQFKSFFITLSQFSEELTAPKVVAAPRPR